MKLTKLHVRSCINAVKTQNTCRLLTCIAKNLILHTFPK